MIHNFVMTGNFKINFIKNIYNNSNCSNIINTTIDRIYCEEYYYNEYKSCCNDYINQKINPNQNIDTCYNNNNTIYQYECNYIENFDWFISIISFLVLMLLCVCCLVYKNKQYELEEEKKRLISVS